MKFFKSKYVTSQREEKLEDQDKHGGDKSQSLKLSSKSKIIKEQKFMLEKSRLSLIEKIGKVEKSIVSEEGFLSVEKHFLQDAKIEVERAQKFISNFSKLEDKSKDLNTMLARSELEIVRGKRSICRIEEAIRQATESIKEKKEELQEHKDKLENTVELLEVLSKECLALGRS